MFSCRSRFEPSGAFESFTCRQRSRSRPNEESSSSTQPVELGPVGDVVARHVEVARVEADAEPRVPVERLVERRQLVDGAADRAAGAGGVLHQEPGVSEQRSSACAQRRHDALEARLEAGAQVRADVEDDASASIAQAASTVERSVVTLFS